MLRFFCFCLLVSVGFANSKVSKRSPPDVNWMTNEQFLGAVNRYVKEFPSVLKNLSILVEEAIVESSNAKPPAPVYWWYYNRTDCNNDVRGSCAGSTMEGCQQICESDPFCGGFNYPSGWLKNSDCINAVIASPYVDLYLKQHQPQPAPITPWPPIWPYPASFMNGSTQLYVNANNFTFVATNPSTDLTNAFNRYMKLFFPHPSLTPPSPAMTQVIVTATDVSGNLQLGTDESYTLIVPSDGTPATITAQTEFGAFRALETLSQLIVFGFNNQTYTIPATPWKIDDLPRFAWREILIDTSRHFQPIQSLMNLIDSLPYAKINTIHWHMTDSQSFPFDSPSHPELAQNGSYSPQERYTPNDVSMVIEYGRQRGVRFVVEIDTPGHAASWCYGHPSICPDYPTCDEPLNPATNETFQVISDLFYDLTGGAQYQGIFYDNLMHLGGDEVNTDCWSESPSIAAWMNSMNFTTNDAYLYFVNQTQQIAHGYGRQVVNWEEVWDNFGTSLDPSTVIQVWYSTTVAPNITGNGYRCLWSVDGLWYLDGLTVTWQTMYSQEPCTGIDPETCENFMLGGGGEMWGETVDTSDLQQTIWPRMAAIAERLWSPQNITDLTQAHARYSQFRCLLNRRGIAAAPANNQVAREAPPGPGSCPEQ